LIKENYKACCGDDSCGLVEIAASGFGACEIGVRVRKWLNVGMSEKLGVKSVYAAWTRNSSFTVHSLFKVLATVVHNYVDPAGFSA
jgi:hypothetical protein